MKGKVLSPHTVPFLSEKNHVMFILGQTETEYEIVSRSTIMTSDACLESVTDTCVTNCV